MSKEIRSEIEFKATGINSCLAEQREQEKKN